MIFFADAFCRVIPDLDFIMDLDDDSIYFFTSSMLRDGIAIEYVTYTCEHDRIHTSITVLICTEDDASEHDLFSGAKYLESIELLTIIREIIQLHKDHPSVFEDLMNMLSGQSMSSEMQTVEESKREVYERISDKIKYLRAGGPEDEQD